MGLAARRSSAILVASPPYGERRFNLAEREKITQDTLVSVTEFASTVGITSSRVYQLITDGKIETVSRGKLNLSQSVQRYIKNLVKGNPSEEDQESEKAKRRAEAQIKVAKAAIAKMEADELKGKMHRSSDVRDFTEDLIMFVRDALFSLPSRLAKDIETADSAMEIYDILRKEVSRVACELRSYKYDPKKYDERVRRRMLDAESGDRDEEDESDD